MNQLSLKARGPARPTPSHLVKALQGTPGKSDSTLIIPVPPSRQRQLDADRGSLRKGDREGRNRKPHSREPGTLRNVHCRAEAGSMYATFKTSPRTGPPFTQAASSRRRAIVDRESYRKGPRMRLGCGLYWQDQKTLADPFTLTLLTGRENPACIRVAWREAPRPVLRGVGPRVLPSPDKRAGATSIIVNIKGTSELSAITQKR